MISDNNKIFDRHLVRRNRNRAAAAMNRHRFLIDWITANLTDRLDDIKRVFPLALQIGAQTAFSNPAIETLIQMDLAECLLTNNKGGLRLQADEEYLPFAANSLDLVISPFNLHSVNDLPGTLIQINRALKPDGLFLAALPGRNTLHELRQAMMQAELSVKGGASPRVAPFADKQQLGALLQRAGYALPVVDSETVTITYDHPLKLMHDLRGMGESNMMTDRPRTNTGKKFLAETIRLYEEQYAESDGRITATFEIIFLIGWAPHDSQQQPQRPGSAKTSLAETLGTKEIAVSS